MLEIGDYSHHHRMLHTVSSVLFGELNKDTSLVFVPIYASTPCTVWLTLFVVLIVRDLPPTHLSSTLPSHYHPH